MRCDDAWTTLWSVFDLTALAAEAARLERESADPDFWSDGERARLAMRRLADRQRTLSAWRGLQQQIDDAGELLELALLEAESDDAVDDDFRAELEREIEAIADDLEAQAFQLAFSGPYDERDAIIAIFGGAGGTESHDWAQMLLRMYQRWAERAGYQTELLDSVEGDEAGLRSATLEVRGGAEDAPGGAYGWLRSEHGVHRLVRISPFDPQHSRHTSFARVEVMPQTESHAEIEIDDDDLKIDVYRASGNGGQNVQKNSTAVRITHLPTNTVVACQNERSLRRNRESAMRVLESRLLQQEIERLEAERLALRGEHIEAGWGNQIRSYVLQPYRMVKDLRTQHETANTESVLEGEIDEFLRAYLQSQIGADPGLTAEAKAS